MPKKIILYCFSRALFVITCTISYKLNWYVKFQPALAVEMFDFLLKLTVNVLEPFITQDSVSSEEYSSCRKVYLDK